MRFGSGDSRNFAGLAPTFLIFVRSDTGATLTPPAISEIASTWGLYTFQYGATTPISFLIDGATTGLSAGNRYIAGAIDPADRTDEYGTTMVAIGNTLIFDTGPGMGSTLQAIGNTLLFNCPAGMGSTLQALGNTLIFNTPNNMGATLVAIGNTAIAYGTTNFAIGTTNLAYGTTNIALGTTSVAWGLANNTAETNMGTTLVAIGNTSIALGSTILAEIGITTSGFGALIGSVGSTFGGSGSDPVDLFGYLKRLQENLEGNSIYTKQSGVWDIYSRGSSTKLISKTVTNGTSTVSKL